MGGWLVGIMVTISMEHRDSGWGGGVRNVGIGVLVVDCCDILSRKKRRKMQLYPVTL